MTTEAVMLPPAQRLTQGLRPILLLVGVALAVAAGVAITLWSVGPTYSVLHAGLAADETAQVAQALDAARIPYKIDDGTGSIRVPSAQLSAARLKLAGDGLPGLSSGFESMSKEPGFGVSQFMENARYQHAIEVELARTISSVQHVQAARVHLAVPRQSSFVRDRRPATASVFLQLKAGRRLEGGQVSAIVNLVASSIPELEPAQVTVVDQQGRLLSARQIDGDEALRDKMLEYARDIEQGFTQRIEELISPLVGPAGVRAQVVAQVDMSTTEEAREQYNPERQVVRSEQTSEQSSRNSAGDNAAGVPGALTNQPPQPGVALPPGAAPTIAQTGNVAAGAAAAAGGAATTVLGPDSTSKQSTRNFEIDRTLAYTRQPAGRITRLTVAVLVDNLRTVDEAGKATETPLTEKQLEHITKLVRDAVGYNESRGDSVNVVNSSFRSEPEPAAGELESIPIWEQPWAQDLAKILAGVIVLLVLAFTVVKPLLKSLVEPLKAQAMLPAAMPAAAAGTAAPLNANPTLAYEQQVAAARDMVAQDPKRVAQVVKTWVADDE
ncbi:MAG TPA: flagellar basal-body MS-ring/collar protein FliF [Steroidobacteraceae bacterium]|nr:flagellar basal-body MS-ring/collar protein FliF [Steroidobacteraceae bacterium]HRX90811.1 flagellar basal-body MS-ring/collar protein FliF [Steroidobacteraceae bacterium]